jgi:hypothetical protein
MPVIREYQRQVSAPGAIQQPQYSPNQFGAQEGRALENLGGAVSQVADVVAKRLDQENTSDVTQKLTKANADLAMDLQNTLRTAQPGDKKVFEDYNKRVEDTLGKIGEEANTVSARNFYGDTSVRIRAQLTQTAANGQADLAGVKAVTDYTSSLNNLSAATLADPSSASLQRELHGKTIENLVATGQLPREKALQLQMQGDQALAKSAVRGWIQLDPEYAKQKMKTGEFDKDLGAEGKVQLYGEADQAIRGKEIDIERRRAQQERVVKQQQQQTQNKMLQAMVDGSLDTKSILNSNLEAFGSGSKEQFLNMLKMANSSEVKLKDDGAVVQNLYSRIHLPDGDPNKLTDENELNNFFGRGLGFAGLNHLRDEMQGRQTEAGKIESDMKKQVFEIAKSKLTKSNPMIGIRDPEGDENMARFNAFFQQEYKEQRAKGVLASALLNPDSPQYLGKNIAQYVRTPQQIMQSLVKTRTQAPQNTLSGTLSPQGAEATTYKPPPKAPVVPRQPGESAAAYIQRIKAGK